MSPAWLALTVHVPGASNVIVLPFVPPAVQTTGVLVLNVTGNPDVAVALTVTGESASVLFASAAKVIVCATFDTVKLRVTAGAALYTESPDWVARTVHVPGPRSVIVAPLVPPLVQIEGVVELKSTVRPDDAVATTITGDCAIVLAASAANEIVWFAFDTVKLRLTAGAGL